MYASAFPIYSQPLTNRCRCPLQNVSKVLGNAANVLYSDPGRRFLWGITIENTETRFWFISRSHIVVSETFDFTSVRYQAIYVCSLH